MEDQAQMHQNANRVTPTPGGVVEVECRDLDRDGKGLASWNNWILVIPDLLPGERARVQFQQRQKSRWIARTVDLLSASENRRKPPCMLANQCGGCTLQSLEESAQTRWKQQMLQQTMARVGGISTDPRPVLHDSARLLGYRNRALIPLRRDDNGALKGGYFRPRSHRIVNMNQCPVLDPRLDCLIQPIKADLDATGWPADHDLHHGGGLRHLGLRVGHHTGDVLITLISSHRNLPGLRALAEQWLARWSEVKGVTLNLQPKPSNLILGAETDCVAGSDTIAETFCGLALRLGSTTFFQVNTPQAERIVSTLAAWLSSQTFDGHVIDAYSGIGTISLPLAQSGLRVVGLELHQASVDQARISAMQNNLSDQCDFVAGDVLDSLERNLPGAGALVLDPPRRGLDAKVVDLILSDPPPLLAYLSCDPATQARDLKLLLDPNGPYTLDDCQPVDFFPQTTHLESLALLKRRKP